MRLGNISTNDMPTITLKLVAVAATDLTRTQPVTRTHDTAATD